MDLPGRVNNLYKERIIIEPEYEITPIIDEKSQGCKFARTAGYGTLEYCTQPSDYVNIPPRYFQLDENVRVEKTRLQYTNFDSSVPFILLILLLILYLAKR